MQGFTNTSGLLFLARYCCFGRRLAVLAPGMLFQPEDCFSCAGDIVSTGGFTIFISFKNAFNRGQPWEPRWEENFAFAAGTVPVVATEFGLHTDMASPDYQDYGNRIIRFLEDRGISWMCWIYDPEWWPQMLKSWNYELTSGGEFLSKAMKGELDFQKE